MGFTFDLASLFECYKQFEATGCMTEQIREEEFGIVSSYVFIRTLVRAFYDAEHVIIIDTLLRHEMYVFSWRSWQPLK
ncbi:hypothetical protein CGCFRS4_v016142, partial [Colletotrichum fructicola]